MISLPLRPRCGPNTARSFRLGHTSIAFAMQFYQHVLPSMQADAAATFGETVFGT